MKRLEMALRKIPFALAWNALKAACHLPVTAVTNSRKRGDLAQHKRIVLRFPGVRNLTPV